MGVMKIKVTNVAREEIGRLDPQTRKTVIAALQDDLMRSADDSPPLKLEELNEDIRVFLIEPLDMRVLYKLEDVDHDGESEVVILTVIDRHGFADLEQEGGGRIEGFRTLNDLPRSARIGREVLSEIARLQP